MALNVKANININAIVNSRINKDLKLYAHSRLRDYCDAYVPYDTGLLSRNVRVTEEAVHYTQNYAIYPYTGTNLNFKTEHHPLATSYWDKAMMAAKGDQFARELSRYIKMR